LPFCAHKFYVDWPRIKLGPLTCKSGVLSLETNWAILVYLFTIVNIARSVCKENLYL